MAHRYAVYWAPAPGSALHDFGASWLGRDAASGAEPPPPASAPADWRAATEDPRLYGFHGTLKAPFRLVGEEAALLAALEMFAAGRAPFEIPPLRLARLGRFLALIPSAPSPALMDLAADCVRDFDCFRAPAPPEELARRRAAGLGERQEANLVRWGYPHVMEDFRFHLTLSGKLDPATAERFEAVLAPLTAPFCAAPLRIDAVTLFEQPAPGAPMRATRRFAFGG